MNGSVGARSRHVGRIAGGWVVETVYSGGAVFLLSRSDSWNDCQEICVEHDEDHTCKVALALGCIPHLKRTSSLAFF